MSKNSTCTNPKRKYFKIMYLFAGWLSYQRTSEAVGWGTLSSCGGFEGELQGNWIPQVRGRFSFNIYTQPPSFTICCNEGVLRQIFNQMDPANTDGILLVSYALIQPRNKSFPSTAGDDKTINDTSQHRCAKSSSKIPGHFM